jgi:hypothetical protein
MRRTSRRRSRLRPESGTSGVGTSRAPMGLTFPTTPRRSADVGEFAGPYTEPVREASAPGAAPHHVSLTQRFGSVSELLAYAVAKQGANIIATAQSGGGWTGAHSFVDALALARDGWHEGAVLADAASSALVSNVKALTTLPVPYLDVVGQSVDVGAYLSGEPEAFIAFRSEASQAPGSRVIRISYHCGVSGGVDASVIVARGAATLALVRILETVGYSVELILTFGSTPAGGSARQQASAPLKAADQPLDVERLAFWLAHPAALRYLVFAVFDGWGVSVSGNRPADVSAELRGDVHISEATAGNVQWSSAASAHAWILARLADQGVSLE